MDTMTKTTTATSTKVILAIVVFAGMGLLGIASGALPTIKTAQPDLVVLISESADPFPSGGSVSYDVTVANIGKAAVSLAEVSLLLPTFGGPSGYSDRSGGTFPCVSTVSSKYLCKGSLAAGAKVVIGNWGLNADATGSVCGSTVTGTIAVVADPRKTVTESNETNNVKTEMTTESAATACPDITASLSESADPIATDCLDSADGTSSSCSSATVTYRLTATNGGTADASSEFQITPSELGNYSWSVMAPFDCVEGSSANEISCVGPVPAGSSVSVIEFSVMVADELVACGTSVNGTVTVNSDPGNLVSESNEDNNQANETTTYQAAACP